MAANTITVNKYYYAGTQRVAMRSGSTLYYLLGDQLGSTSLTTDSAGTVISELRYTAWGEVRYQAGTTPTNYTYTGQYTNTAGFGLMFYNARWYDPAIGRFAQADTIIPEQSQGTQAWDRYAYVNNNPMVYFDATGHDAVKATTITFSSATSFNTAAQNANTAIGTMRGFQSKLLIGGATLIGALGFVAGAAAGTLVGHPVEGAVGVAAITVGGTYALGSEMLLDQYDTDLQNLTDMQVIVNGMFADGATGVTMTIMETQVTLNDSLLTGVVPVTITVQNITICSNLGVCKTYQSSPCPSNQHAIDRFFTPTDEDENESEVENADEEEGGV